MPPPRSPGLVLLLLAALALLAYAPLFTQPLLQDDYPSIELARTYGPSSAWGAALSDSVFRYRAAWLVLVYWTERLFGMSPAAFYAVTIAMHVLAAWLVYALGTWPAIGWRASAVAAAFFTVYEGHQEAVMWLSASTELLMFLFGVASFLCWVKFLNGGAGKWYAASLASFILALASKEAGFVFAALFLIPLASPHPRRVGFWLPFAVLAAAQVWMIAGARSNSFRFQDGSFSLHAPFWITLPQSYFRMLWVWGVLALAALVLLRAREHRRLVAAAAVWMAVALVPYSFLTYMHRVPSRHTYLASAGLAWIVAAAFLALRDRCGRRWAAVAAAVVIVANVGYLWTKKRQQFLERAAPTEALLQLAARVNGPIYVRCYPDPPIIADAAVKLLHPATTLIWDAARAGEARAEFCFRR